MTQRTMTRLFTLAALGAAMGCADKELSLPRAALSPRIALQITATNMPAQVGSAPLYLLTGAFYLSNNTQKDDDMQLLAIKWTRVQSGSQQITLPVDIAPCLADNSRMGTKDGCSMYLAAIITPDSSDVQADSSADPMRRALDYAFPMGPYDVVPGRAPVIPPIDLSLSRFAVVDWQKDEALRLGGNVNPFSAGGVLFGGLAPIAGYGSGSGAPTIYALTKGSTFVPNNGTQPVNNPFYPQLQIFEGGQWRRVAATTAPSSANFFDVTALGTTDVYMASSAGLYRYDGTAIAKVAGVTTDSLYALGSATVGSAKYVIAGGAAGVVWIGYGTNWQRYNMPSSVRLDGVCINGAAEAFASSSSSGALFRFDGTSWVSVPASTTGPKGDLQCAGPGQAYVLNQGGPLFKWNGSTWVTMPTSGIGPGRLIRWGVVSGSEIYAFADSGSVDRAFYRFDGSTWQPVGRTRFTQQASRPWADPRGGAAYVMSGFGRLERVTPSGVTVLSYMPSLRDVVVNSATSAFAVGWNNFLARWDGAKWTIDAPPAGIATRLLNAVWSDGPKNAWAVGSGSTILRYDGASWSTVSDNAKPITGAADFYYGVWGSGSDVWIAGESGITHCKAPTACALEYASQGMYGLWGSSPTNVFAVGTGGKILRYNGSVWTPMSSPTNRLLVRISGVGTQLAYAIGDSTVVRFDGTNWSTVQLTDNARNSGFMKSPAPAPGLQLMFQLGIWVRGPKEVYIGSDYGMIARYDGTEWRESLQWAAYQRRIVAISGTKDGCVLALAEGQSDLPGPTMLRGISPSGCFAAPMAPPTVWP